MKAITICQPWAWAIAAGHKIIENRPRAWHHRGPIAIHAGLSKKWLREGCEFLESRGIVLPERFEMGAVIAVAQLVDCRPLEWLNACKRLIDRDSDVAHQIDEGWVMGPWCLLLRDALRIPPIAAKGQLGLWECSLDRVTGPSPLLGALADSARLNEALRTQFAAYSPQATLDDNSVVG